MSKHVILRFKGATVLAEKYHEDLGTRVFKVNGLEAKHLVEALACQSFANVAELGAKVIINRQGSFVTSVTGGWVVTIVGLDSVTKCEPITDYDARVYNANAQWRSEKRKCPSQIGNGPSENPLPSVEFQVLELTSFGTRLDNKWGVTGVIGGLSAEDIVSQIRFHQDRNQSYNIKCPGLQD